MKNKDKKIIIITKTRKVKGKESLKKANERNHNLILEREETEYFHSINKGILSRHSLEM